MTPDELRALADALPEGVHWSDPITPDMLAEAIRRFCADAQPVAWIGPSRPKIDGADYRVLRQDYDASHGYGWSRDTAKANGFLPLYAHPAPAVPAGWKLVPVEPTPEMLSAVGMMDGYDWHAPGCSPDADHANWYSAMIAAAPAAPQAEPKREPLSDSRPCTCHPDDNPPVPCAQKYALNECRAVHGEPTEAQIKARDALLDFISENGTASEGVQHYLDRYVRAALAAKD